MQSTLQNVRSQKFMKGVKKSFGSQQEGHGRAYLQKQSIIRRYRKELRSKHVMGTGQSDLKIQVELDKTANQSVEGDPFIARKKKPKKSKWQLAQLEYQTIEQEKRNRKDELLRIQNEMELSRQKYQEKRLQRYKKLSQRTKKGQPVMSGRIELMLQSLQEEAHTNLTSN